MPVVKGLHIGCLALGGQPILEGGVLQLLEIGWGDWAHFVPQHLNDVPAKLSENWLAENANWQVKGYFFKSRVHHADAEPTQVAALGARGGVG